MPRPVMHHVAAAGVVQWQTHPAVGTIPVHTIPGIAHPRDGERLAVAPRTGEHTREILASLGYSAADVEAALASGAMKAAS